MDIPLEEETALKKVSNENIKVNFYLFSHLKHFVHLENNFHPETYFTVACVQ